MNGGKLFNEIKKKLGMPYVTDSQLKKLLGHTNISQYRNREVTEKIVAGFVDRYGKYASKHARENSIRTVVEFFPLQKRKSRQEKKWELFPRRDSNPNHHRHCEALRAAEGVYVFFDSRGKALYVGKTKKSDLWTEMNLAFNRDRDVQQIFRIDHPADRKVQNKPRQIKKHKVQLHELAHYFSAYDVHSDIIDTVEALLIRTSANDLLNRRMENLRDKQK